jgi:carbon monoxide dehydrogenase subunit G
MHVVHASAEISASQTAVWEKLADFGAIEQWSPVVIRSFSTSDATEGLEASRHCDLFPRGEVEEQIVEWEPERLLGINVDPAGPIAKQRSEFELEASDTGTRVTMRVSFDLLPEMEERADRIEAAYQAACDGSVAGLRHHLETGQPVGTELPS